MQAERIRTSFSASSSNHGSVTDCCCFSGEKSLKAGPTLPFSSPRQTLQAAKTPSASTRGSQLDRSHSRSFRIRATNGPPSRRRTEVRRRPPDYPPSLRRPPSPGEFSDNENFDVDLDYLAAGGTRTKETIERQDNFILKHSYTRYLLGGMFILGIAAGIALDSVVNIEPNNVASREVIDRQTPNPDVCLANGMSALVLDQRLFVSFNPFNVYVSQAEVKPGCVLRQSNWQVLESRGLVTGDEVRDCKKNMNTFGFVGDLRKSPEVSCIYHSETAENQFLKDPSKAALGDGFQPKESMPP